MEIKAADVMKLRHATNAGMMDCKKALQEAEGDFDKAVDIIRKRGLIVASKRADREGYPEVAEAFKRYAWEEAEHAAKFAELLGAE